MMKLGGLQSKRIDCSELVVYFVVARIGVNHFQLFQIDIMGLSPNTNYKLVVLAGNIHVTSSEREISQITSKWCFSYMFNWLRY